MTRATRLTIWGLRWTVARGWTWTAERQCDALTADGWLKVFGQDEPNVAFVASVKVPNMEKALAGTVSRQIKAHA